MVTPTFQLWQPIPLDILKKKRPRHYQKITLDLGIARTNELFWCVGDFIGVETITGSCTIRINEVGRDTINLQKVKKTYTPFYRFYMTNTAQAGKTLTLYIGGDAAFEIDVVGKTGIVDSEGSDIDPIESADTPAIYNVTMPSADTEYTQALPSNCLKFLIHTRDGTAIRLAFVTGKVATPTAPYFTVPTNESYFEDHIKPSSLTLYFACASAGKVVEIIAWS
ncbi:hypothetical protein ES703_92181 [subsurface metagenome]